MELTRRQFGHALGAGLAVAGLPLLGQESETRRIRFAVVGLGRISLQHFMPASKMSQHCEVVALVSGHRDKALKYAAEYNVPEKNIYDYENYDRIADNKDIDAVYIGLPNSMHSEYTIRAANAGKHVLCEKPMASNVRDCESMIAACKAAGKKLMIAYRCQYEPTNLHAIKLIRDGWIGDVQLIESANGFNIHPGEWRLTKKLAGGGPLMDVGIYSLNACRFLVAEEPSDLSAYASVIDKDGRFKEVEENLSWTMKFPSGVLATCTTSYGTNTGGWYRVHGSKGTITMEPAFSYQGIHMKAQAQGQSAIDELEEAKDPSQFVTEGDEFALDILHDRVVKASGEEGLRDMKWIEKIYRGAGIKL